MDCAAREHPAIDAATARQMLATLADPYVEDDGEL